MKFKSKWISLVIAALLVVGLGSFLAFSSADQPQAKEETPAKGSTIKLKTLDGQVVSLKDYQGKVVLLNFWATWCPPCVAEIPDLVKLHTNYKDKGFTVLGVVVENPGLEAKVRKMVKDFEMSYPVVWGTQELVDEFGPIQAIPRSFFLNQDGKVVEDIEGMGNYQMFEKLVKKYTGQSS